MHKEDTREDGPWTIGEDKCLSLKKGQRTDMEDLYALCKTRPSLTAVVDAFPGLYIRYPGGVERTLRLCRPRQRSWQTFVHVYYGPGGTGKSTRALFEAEQLAPGDVYTVMKPSKNGTLWWDGYDGQAVVIMDEFSGSWMTREDWRKICDRTPCPVQTKGGSTQFLAKHVFFTSNIVPEDWWRNIGFEDSDMRRLIGELGCMELMEGPGVWQPPGAQQYVPQDPATIRADYLAMRKRKWRPEMAAIQDDNDVEDLVFHTPLSSQPVAPLADNPDLISATFGDPNPTFRFSSTASNYFECNVPDCAKQVGARGDECRFHSQLTRRGGQPLWDQN